MTEPLLKISARFDIREDQELPLNGRAYLSTFNFKQAYHSDLVYAVNNLRRVVESPDLIAARLRKFKHTVAIMWGSSSTEQDQTSHQIIDFLGWQYQNWDENGEISCWQTRNGVMMPPLDFIAPVTCEGGEDILHAEQQYRRVTSQGVFQRVGPDISPAGLRYELDFCNPIGRDKLKELMKKGSYIIK